MNEVDPLRTFKTTSFGGIPCAQYFVDFYLWECILNENPQLTRIIELGTWMGGFSLYLKAQADARNWDFVTFDSVLHMSRPIPNFNHMDIFANSEYVIKLMSLGPCALFCDNGNKPREVEVFGQYLSNDSILVVHDWNTEFTQENVPDCLEEIYGDFCDNLGSVSRVYRRKE